MRALSKMILTDARLLLRTPMVIIVTLGFPILLLLTAASNHGTSPLSQFGGLSAVDLAVPGFIAIMVSLTGLLDLPLAVVMRRQQGVLRRYRATPLSAWVVLASQITIFIAMTLAGVVLLLLIGKIAFGLVLPQNPLALTLAVVASSAAFLSLGFFLSGLLPSINAVRGVGMVLFIGMMYLSNLMNPRAALSAASQPAANFIPLTYVTRLVNDAWFGKSLDPAALIVVAGMLVISGLLTLRFFRWE